MSERAKSPAATDPLAYAEQLMSQAQAMYADAQRRSAALAALSAEATSAAVSVKVGPGGRLVGFTLDPDEPVPSPAQLCTAFRQAYDEACALITRALARDSGGLDASIGELAPTPEQPTIGRPVVGSLHGVDEGAADAGSEESSSGAPGQVPVDPPAGLPVDDEFDRLLATLDEGEPEDLSAFVNDPLFQRLVPTSDPASWQQELEQQVAELTAHTAELTELAATIVGEHRDKLVTLAVFNGGKVDRVVFHAPAADATHDELSRAVVEGYRAAAEDAQQRLQVAIADSGLAGSWSPATDPGLWSGRAGRDRPRW
ncbi:hypothetical protein [Aestuariimicrobium sp. T2.26MG-19.2B]|uniref:hypothetical protein n=1 Tax=Aestuariimicrobium sp. T2.26MG-19.2B TaxID=3040679 RepID=UPI0024778CDE|nr:hypothetical protein [Aestuariimicrobium sp. T2.26MG-19.2B]CAI9405688.1 hypothetical protein AESSP_01465 [Aestuariimicrobium sp. T2.26MG-19.2B]